MQPPDGVPGALANVDFTFRNHRTFHYTGAAQSFTVPAKVSLIKVVALGAAGGGKAYYHGSLAGRGGRISAVVPVRAGERLHIYVGGAGYWANGYQGGFNGGALPGEYFGGATGGGGASDVREGGMALRFRVVVAGGGGGWGADHGGGGGGGGGASSGSGFG